MNEKGRVLGAQNDIPVMNNRVMAARKQKFNFYGKPLQIVRFPGSHLQCVSKLRQ
jgi:hypothetical protein